MSALKPCPFCGRPPVTFPSQDGPGLMIECMTVTCVRPQYSAYGAGVAEAVWNNRAVDAEVRPKVSSASAARPLPAADIQGQDQEWPSDAVVLAAYGKYRTAREEKLSGRSAMRSALREARRAQSLKPFSASMNGVDAVETAAE